MYWQLEVFTKQPWLCHGKEMVSREGVTGAFPASEVCPALPLRCWGDGALGFFHYIPVMRLVWFTQCALAASAGFCGSSSAARAGAQTLPGLHSKYNTHGEETSINNLFSHVKDDIVPRSLVLFHFVNLVVPTGCCTIEWFQTQTQKRSGDCMGRTSVGPGSRWVARGARWRPLGASAPWRGSHGPTELCPFRVISVSNHQFLCVTIWLRSVSPFWL